MKTNPSTTNLALPDLATCLRRGFGRQAGQASHKKYENE